jgi:carbon monoxide dehydrogenase subunit G
VRWAYRIDRTTLPLSSAHVECTELEDHDTGTRLRWTLAAEPRLLMRLTSPFMPRMLDDLLQRAARKLDRHLSEA